MISFAFGSTFLNFYIFKKYLNVCVGVFARECVFACSLVRVSVFAFSLACACVCVFARVCLRVRSRVCACAILCACAIVCARAIVCAYDCGRVRLWTCVCVCDCVCLCVCVRVCQGSYRHPSTIFQDQMCKRLFLRTYFAGKHYFSGPRG